MTEIVVLQANQPPRRPYRGGPQIADFRGIVHAHSDDEVHVNETTLTPGSTAVVPHGAGPIELTGSGEVLLARPPQP